MTHKLVVLQQPALMREEKEVSSSSSGASWSHDAPPPLETQQSVPRRSSGSSTVSLATLSSCSLSSWSSAPSCHSDSACSSSRLPPRPRHRPVLLSRADVGPAGRRVWTASRDRSIGLLAV